MRIAGTDTAPSYTYTMAFSMVPVADAYSMAGEPPPNDLRPTTAPVNFNRNDPGQADGHHATRPPPTPSPPPATLHGNGCPPSPLPTSERARARARTPTQFAPTTHHAATLTAHDGPLPTVSPTTVAEGIEVEYARISHVVSTALRGGDARPCNSQARYVLNVHRAGSAKRRKAVALQPAARVQHRYRALTLLLYPDRTASELLRHRTMARLAWDAVQTAHAYMLHTDRMDEHFPLEQRRPPTTPFTGLWLPVPRARANLKHLVVATSTTNPC